MVLVVAADDGVMPQTEEAIAHATDAKVPIVVAINKCDRPGTNPMQVRQQLSVKGLQTEEWGGTTQVVDVSATTGQGLDELVEKIMLESEILELTAKPSVPGMATVIESKQTPEQGVVGPGMCRVTYGGFLLSYPPRRMLDVWTDADYRMAERKSEVLLLAALDYSEERVVVHVAQRPPRSLMHQVAARVERKILHVPIGTLSKATLRRIRVMHILSGHEKREIAKDYIW